VIPSLRHVPKAEGRPVLGGRLTLKIGAGDTGEAYSLLRGHTPPGLGPPLHVHAREDETFYVKSGTYDMQCGGEIVRVNAGTCLHLPRYTPHTFRNAGDETAELVELMTPGGLERYFDAVEFLGPEAEDLEQRSEVGRPFGISFPDAPTDVLDPPTGEARRPISVVSTGEGRALDLSGHPATSKVELEEAGGLHSLLELTLAPGAVVEDGRLEPGHHVLLFVLDGGLTVRADSARIDAWEDDAVAVAPDVAFWFGSLDGVPLRVLLCAIAPARPEP
jgi:mannose-6-phosphate isomerase-like protein (cupin superfamily)